MKIVYKENSKENNDINYIQLCVDEMLRLNTFNCWSVQKNLIVLNSKKYANINVFIKLGILQSALKNVAYFQGGYDGFVLSLTCDFKKTWKDVYEILSSIDYIDISE